MSDFDWLKETATLGLLFVTVYGGALLGYGLGF